MKEKKFDADKVMEAYTHGFNEGVKHQKPAPETERRLSALEGAIKEMSKAIQEIKEALIEIKQEVAITSKLIKRIERNEKDIQNLKMWKYGLGMVLAFTIGIGGYVITLIEKNLELSIKQTSLEIVRQELSKYEITK